MGSFLMHTSNHLEQGGRSNGLVRSCSLLENTTSGPQIQWAWHPRLGHVRPSADGKTDSVNTRPVAFAAEAYKYLLDQKQSTHRDTVP